MPSWMMTVAEVAAILQREKNRHLLLAIRSKLESDDENDIPDNYTTPTPINHDNPTNQFFDAVPETPHITDWIENDYADVLLLKKPLTFANENCRESMLSLFCAVLTESIIRQAEEKPESITLTIHWFCGQYKNKTCFGPGGVAGRDDPKAMLSSLCHQLIAEVLSQPAILEHNLGLHEFHIPRTVPPSLEELMRVFVTIAGSLPFRAPGRTNLWCIIDSISDYADDARKAECETVLKELNALVTYCRCCVKLLYTAPSDAPFEGCFEEDEIFEMVVTTTSDEDEDEDEDEDQGAPEDDSSSSSGLSASS